MKIVMSWSDTGATMARTRTKTVYECSDCGAIAPRWEGQCRGCDAWNTLKEVTKTRSSGSSGRIVRSSGNGVGNGPGSPAILISDISSDSSTRISFGIPELDRVFGGGVVPGSVTLLAGDPGIGKSTLILQASASIADSGSSVLYSTGEESGAQVKMRAQRLGVGSGDLYLQSTNRIEDVLAEAERMKPKLVVLDSIQTVTSAASDSLAGTPSQIQACAGYLSEFAKRSSVPVILTGHVTKDGSIAGPRLLEHAVDVVLHLGGESTSGLRLLQGSKNRYGATNELGVFEMRSDGLKGVGDPSKAFLAHRRASAPGSAIASLVEGTRSITVEVQALTSPSNLPTPRRVATGIEISRLHLILAVLSRRLRVPVSDQDVIVNVPGGLRVTETAIDLPVALAIVSSLRDKPLNEGVAAAAEIGLGGELRPVQQGERRARESSRLGLTSLILGRQPDKEALEREKAAGALHCDMLGDAIAEAIAGDSDKRRW
jgi:DNA repair protein RadA/Sms